MQRTTKLGIAVVAIGGIIAAWVFLPLDTWLRQLAGWIQDAGALGVLVYAGAYVIAGVAMLPGSVITLAAGFAWGPVWGVAIVSPVSVLTSTVAFLLGRTLLRDWVRGRVETNPKFAAIDDAVGRNGFKIVLLLRLSPIFPYNLLNYTLGLTSVRLTHYVLASFLGMLPGTVLFVYLGSLVTSVGELLGGQQPDGGPLQNVLYWGGLAATLVVTVLVTRIARRSLADAIDASGTTAEGESLA